MDVDEVKTIETEKNTEGTSTNVEDEAEQPKESENSGEESVIEKQQDISDDIVLTEGNKSIDAEQCLADAAQSSVEETTSSILGDLAPATDEPSDKQNNVVDSDQQILQNLLDDIELVENANEMDVDEFGIDLLDNVNTEKASENISAGEVNTSNALDQCENQAAELLDTIRAEIPTGTTDDITIDLAEEQANNEEDKGKETEKCVELPKSLLDDVQMVDLDNDVAESIVPPVLVENDAIEEQTKSPDAVESVQVENETVPDETKAVNAKVDSEGNTNESIDVFDLLKENEELFAKADSELNINIADAQGDVVDTAAVSTGSEMAANDGPPDTNVLSITIDDNSPVKSPEPPNEPESAAIAVDSSAKSPESANESAENNDKVEEVLTQFTGKECVNLECESGCKIFYEAPEFVISYFHSKKNQNTLYACESCFDDVVNNLSQLCAALEDKQPLYLQPIKYPELVEIIDSSDDEAEDEDAEKSKVSSTKFDKNTLALIEDELENTINQVLTSTNITQQMDWNRQILDAKIEKNDKDLDELFEELKPLQKIADKMYTEIFRFKAALYEEIAPMDLNSEQRFRLPDYPAYGEHKHPEINRYSLYYSFRNRARAQWTPCCVKGKLETDGETMYSIEFLKPLKVRDKNSNRKQVKLSALAYGRAPDVRLKLGARVIALFRDSDPLKCKYYQGTVTEQMCKYNRYRYMIFFDDGYAQYVEHDDLRLKCSYSEDEPWNDIGEADARAYIETFLKEQTDKEFKRPMIQAKKGAKMRCEYNGKWYMATVHGNDASLVHICFDELELYEYIYRGSIRLGPLYRRKVLMTKGNNSNNEISIEYIQTIDDNEMVSSEKPPTPPQVPSTQEESTQKSTEPAADKAPENSNVESKENEPSTTEAAEEKEKDLQKTKDAQTGESEQAKDSKQMDLNAEKTTPEKPEDPKEAEATKQAEEPKQVEEVEEVEMEEVKKSDESKQGDEPKQAEETKEQKEMEQEEVSKPKEEQKSIEEPRQAEETKSTEESLSKEDLNKSAEEVKSTEEVKKPDVHKTPQKPAMQRTFASQAARNTPQQKRAVAKKSTTQLPKPAVQHMNNSTIYVVDEDKPKGKVVYYTAKKQLEVKKYVNHGCKNSCLIAVTHNLNSYSPLSKPLLSGWDRQIAKTRFNKKAVVYRAPCGRRLRDMAELHKYLRITQCPLNVDNFDFDPLIHCLAEYVIDSCIVHKPDYSEGIERMVVPVVNHYDNTLPPPCVYSAQRIPTEGVNLNLDEEFLCGCDCTDDCVDKEKCQCWQLTLAGAKYGNPDTPVEQVGYEYRRLHDSVPTGIYECNSRCKCKKSCLNRVVQNQLQLKMQLFKTHNRGWGLRCLNDVPKGSFICCYAGNLLTEENANEAGRDLGDEYFAELDYIEVVENLKEGYESDVVLSESSGAEDEDFDVDAEASRMEHDDSDDEFAAPNLNISVSSAKNTRYRTRNAVDKQKKEQKKTDKTSPAAKFGAAKPGEDGESRQTINFMPTSEMPPSDDEDDEENKSVRRFYGKDESVYIMDAKKTGNIGRYFNHSCSPNLFVQNVFVDTHDLRFPWVAFFALTHIRAGTELTWNYNYEQGSVPGKILICQCGAQNCRGRIL